MQIGANLWIWIAPITDNHLRRLIPHIAQLGYDWVELPLEVPDSFDYALARDLIGDHGLGVSMDAVISPERDLIHSDASVRAAGMNYVRQAVLAAEAVGVTNLVGPLYAGVGRTWLATADERARDLDLLEGELRELATFAAEHGVILCVEPLNRFETSFINLTSQAVELVDRVGHPACQIMLDTFHMNIEEQSIGDAIRLAGPRLRHVHASENDRGTPGKGHIPWQDIADALADIEYNGPVVIETFTDQVKSIARAAAIWRPLASSPDALARDGLAFLQQLLLKSPTRASAAQ